MADLIKSIFAMDDKQTDELLASILTRPTKELATKIADLDSKIANVKTLVPEKGDKGDKGDAGAVGKNGRDGRDGRDGFNGKDGRAGVDGKDGQDGENGVSIVDVEIALDNHLVITLSNGEEIDAGTLSSNDGQDNFFISTSPQSSGGGSSLSIKDEGVSLTSAVTEINFTGTGVTASSVGDVVTVNIASGGGGASQGIGECTFNFGSGKGSTKSSQIFVPAIGMLSTSEVKIYIDGTDSTVDHNEEEHRLIGSVGFGAYPNFKDDDGFFAEAFSTLQLTGTVKCRFSWITI